MPWNQGSQVRFRFSPILSDEHLSGSPIFWDALNPEPLPVEPSGATGYKTNIFVKNKIIET